jgi:DNA invertase Pin-like site-specific DNA recombinase
VRVKTEMSKDHKRKVTFGRRRKRKRGREGGRKGGREKQRKRERERENHNQIRTENQPQGSYNYWEMWRGEG